MKKKDFLPYTLLFIQPIFMASNLVVARGGVEFVPPISLAFWRWLSVFLLLMLFNYRILYKKKILFKEYKELFFLGLMGCGVCGAFPFMAGQTTTIINMGIIYTSSPIFIILISYFFFKEKMNFFKFIGLLSCLLGVLIIIVRGEYSTLISLKFTKGDLWMLGASIGWALYTIYLFHWKSKLPLIQRFTLISMFGAISLFPFFILEELFILQTSYDLNLFLWVLFAALSPSIVAFLLFNYVNNKLGASITGSVLYLYTVYGAVYGFLFFDEKLEIYHLLGTIMVFIGIFLVKNNVKKV